MCKNNHFSVRNQEKTQKKHSTHDGEETTIIIEKDGCLIKSVIFAPYYELTAYETACTCQKEVAKSDMNSLYIIEKLNRKYGAWLFYTALVLFLVSFSWFWISDVPRQILRIRELLVTVSQVLFLLRIGLLSWKYRGFVLLCAVILFLFYLSSHLSHSSIIKNTALVIAASRDEDKKKVLRIYLLAFLLVLMTAPITCAMGWTGDITKHKYELTGHSWGFFNPNRLAYFLQIFKLKGFISLSAPTALITNIGSSDDE